MTTEQKPYDDDDDDDEEYDEEAAGGGSRMLGFMFGNVDNSGELEEVDYLDEGKEHLDALAEKLGPSLTDIDLSGKSARTPTASATEEEYGKKAENAVDYEDFDEQYEGPEIETASEEDHLLPKREFLSVDVSATTLGSSIFDDENYDEEDVNEKESEAVTHEPEVETLSVTGLVLNVGEVLKSEPGETNLLTQEITAPVEQPENDVAIFGEDPCSKQQLGSSPVQTAVPAGFTDLQEEEPAISNNNGDVKSLPQLPILCVENGSAILRFSEIFGVNEPLKKAGGREHKYSISKDKYRPLDTLPIFEEDEEVFLKGSLQVFSARNPSMEAQDDYQTFVDNDPVFAKVDVLNGMRVLGDERKDSCVSAEPMKQISAVDLSAQWQSCISKKFYPLDQQEWEDEICWGNSPAVSENSVESCELSGPDSEFVVHEERDIMSRPRYPLSNFNSTTDAKDSTCHIAVSTFSMEPFDSRDSATLSNTSCSGSLHHPQLLRLESRVEMDSSDISDTRKELASEESHQLDFMKRFKLLTLQNKDLADGSWIENIVWESEKPRYKPKLIFDLQDEQMVFEIFDNKDYEHLQAHAGAMIMPQIGKTSADVFELPGHLELSGGQFNIANDKYYSNRKTSPQLKSLSKKRAAHIVDIWHSAPALMLQTMRPKLRNKDIANFHRPKAPWYPHDNEVAVKEQEKLPTQGPMKVILKSLGGRGSKIHVDPEETMASFKAKASKKLDFRLTEAVKIFYLGKELEDQKTLAEQNVRPNSLLHLVRTTIHMLPMAQKLPKENKSLRPPGAFKKKSDLSLKDGHVFLMEYCEERPLLLGNAGMGARLCSYYQKSSSDDQTGDMLRNANNGLGTVVVLDPADKSPFLGDIKPGCSQSSLETKMYRAPVFPHRVASSDYLLLRSAKGKLSIRRIDKIHVVGQQEPHCEVMTPGSKGLQPYLMNRLLVYVFREFRAAEKRGLHPCIRADELAALFHNIPEHFLRKRLKQFADLEKGPNGLFHWFMKPNQHIPRDPELRTMVEPEEVCAYESMQAGLYRLKRLGITRLAYLTSPTQLATLSSAINQLPDKAITLAAGCLIERELMTTPWNLSANFYACVRQEKGNIERLEISGVGDPSGRGLGFSFVRIAPKPPQSNALVKKKPVVAKGSTVTGTDADLRRLSMEGAKEVLLKFGVSEENIGKMSRWHRIAMIRKLSSEQAVSGVQADPATISKYARGQRMSFLQLQQQAREKCQDIWDRQFQSLTAAEDDELESESEANSDLDSFAGDLENLLDLEEVDDGEVGSLEMKNHKSDVVKGPKMRRHQLQARLEEDLEDDAAEAAELCRVLMNDDDAKWNKKKKAKPNGKAIGLIRGPQLSFGFGNGQQVRKTTVMVKNSDGPAVPNDILGTKLNADLKEVENFLCKKTTHKKAKAAKNSVLPDIQIKTIKITNANEGSKLKKSARDSFNCGACNQPGHMRTNKNCPKYREDPEAQVNNIDQEKESAKPISLDPSQSQQIFSAKKLMTKNTTNVAHVEASEGEKSSLKAKVLKVKYASADRVPEKSVSVQSLTSEQPSTSEAEVGNKSVPKVIKIISNKTKPDDFQIESQKLNVVIRPPSNTGREPPQKKITIRQPKKEVINLDQISDDGADIEYRKTKKMIELSGFGASRQEDGEPFAEETARRNKATRRMWEEEGKRRNAEQLMEERQRMLYEEEMRMQQEQNRLAELRKYQEDIFREREELQKASKNVKKKRRAIEIRDDYFEDFPAKRNNRLVSENNRSAKRKTIVELGRYGAEYVPPTKRRRGGEVGLANILESIVEFLKDRRDVSYLFLKPVSKKDAPDYLDYVERPMDLSTIREKVRRLEYKNRDEFRHDVCQITINAHLYNDGRNPTIPPLADQLLELCDYSLQERDVSLEEAEASIRDN